MIANTCLESTGRFGMELGYHGTLVRDATAAFSMEAMHAALEISGPTFVYAITDGQDLEVLHLGVVEEVVKFPRAVETPLRLCVCARVADSKAAVQLVEVSTEPTDA